MKDKFEITYDEIVRFLSDYSYEVKNNKESLKKDTFTLASIKNIIEKGVYFITDPYKDQLINLKNSIVFVDFNSKLEYSNILIKVESPQLIHYKLSNRFSEQYSPSIHESAIIHPEANIDKSAHIGPYCVIGKCEIKANVKLLSHITINDNVLILENTIIEANSLIGARGMAWIWDNDGNRVFQPQLGGVTIGKNCVIGSDISIVRGSLSEQTYIGDGTIIAHGTKIGHGSYIGKQVHMANNVSLAGNARIGDKAFLGSASTISSNVTIPEGAIVGAGAVVNKNLETPYSTIVGVPGRIIKVNNFNQKPNGVPKPFKKNN